jgi:hypothetical protein
MKVTRAAEHLKTLQSYLSAFAADPYTISKHDDEERQSEVWTIDLKSMQDIVPISVGEYAHSLRSALDQLAWQLGLLSGQVPDHLSAFPLYANDTPEDRKRFCGATWNIPSAAVEIIKELQPYQRGKANKSQPLWHLNRLSNLDKHEVIGFRATSMNFAFMWTDDLGDPMWIERDDSPGVEIWIPFDRKGKVKPIPQPPHFIFGRPQESPGPDFELSEAEIAEIYRFVRHEVLPRFRGFFPVNDYSAQLPDDLRP